MNTHSCIKCGTSYTSEDVDAYYCPSCVEEKKQIANEIDAKLASRPKRETMSEWQIYQNAPKIHGFPDARHFL